MKDKVYIAAHLKDDKNKKGEKYGESAYHDLKAIDEIELEVIQNHSTYVWCRDYMPVKSSSGKYVQFTFRPPYMTGAKTTWNKRIPKTDKIHVELGLNCIKSDIILDGGAIEVFGKKAIVSDRVFRDNPKMEGKAIIDEIIEILELDQLIIIPQYPGDFTGHVDGLVRFVDENKVVTNNLDVEKKGFDSDINRYRSQLIENWYYTFKHVLINAGLELKYLPFTEPKGKNEILKEEGIYTNFLLLDNLIIMPSYNNENDKPAAMKLENLYQKPVKTVYSSQLANEGGMINCITWTK